MSHDTACMRSCLDGIRSEIASLSVVGRALTPGEIARLEALRVADESLASAIELLDSSTSPSEPIAPSPPPAPIVNPRDGRYEGGDGNRRIEMRVDVEQLGMVSVDVFQISSSGGQTWLATACSRPGEDLTSSAGSHGVVAEDQDGNVVTGTLTVASAGSDENAGVTLELDAPATGISGNVPHNFVASWQGAALRTLGLEVEREQDIDAEPVSERASGETVTITICLAEAGFARFDMGQVSTISPPPPLFVNGKCG